MAREPRPAGDRALSRSTLLVELTREGRDLVAAARPTTLTNKRRLLSSLMAEEQSMLAVLLRKLLLGLEQAEPQPRAGSVHAGGDKARSASW